MAASDGEPVKHGDDSCQILLIDVDFNKTPRV
jgi:hypothetical protein